MSTLKQRAEAVAELAAKAAEEMRGFDVNGWPNLVDDMALVVADLLTEIERLSAVQAGADGRDAIYNTFDAIHCVSVKETDLVPFVHPHYGPGSFFTENCILVEDAIQTRAIVALLPGVYYMDPPDGGSITVLEQLRRMAKDAERYRWLMDGRKLWKEDIKPVVMAGADLKADGLLDEAIDAAISKEAK